MEQKDYEVFEAEVVPPQILAYDPKTVIPADEPIIEGMYAEDESRIITDELAVQFKDQVMMLLNMGTDVATIRASFGLDKTFKKEKRVRTKPVKTPSFKDFVEKINLEFASFDLTKNNYGEQLMTAKIDVILYALVQKGMVTMDELIGTEGSVGFIAAFIENEKEYKRSKM